MSAIKQKTICNDIEFSCLPKSINEFELEFVLRFVCNKSKNKNSVNEYLPSNG